MPDSAFFRDLAYVFFAAALGGGLAWLLRQPLILGYIVGGILISPFTPGPSVADVHTFELFAEIGVVLLMFFIGAEFSPRELFRLKWLALFGGSLGILVLIALGLGTAWLLGWAPLQAMVVGMIVSTASTLALARLLADRGELHSRPGRAAIAITLVDDLAVIAMVILMPSLGTLESGRLWAVGLAMAKAIGILVPFAILAAGVFPRLLAHVGHTRNPELLLLVALAISIGTAAITQAAGLSLALGAVLAGLIISGSDYVHEALARLLPLRDLFVALFFVTVGVLVDPRVVRENLPLIGVMIGLVVLGKLVVWTPIVGLFGYPWPTALLVAVSLTQVGEFSFILARAGMQAGHVGRDVFNATLVTSLLTILVNAWLMRIVPGWLGRAAAPQAGVPAPRRDQASPAPDLLPEVAEVVVGAVGALADRTLREARVRERFGVLVLDLRRADDPVLISPSGDTVLRPGDRLRISGLRSQLAAFREAAEREEEPMSASG